MVAPNPTHTRRTFVCGTRAVYRALDCTYRVVCASCLAGGSVPHSTAEAANHAAVRDSVRPCGACGAK